MLETAKTTILFVSALFPIVNPLGGSPIFLTLTREYTGPDRRLLSQRIAVNSFLLMLLSFLIGTHILSFFGISLPVVQVGGGVIVIAAGWAMLNQKEEQDRANAHRNVQQTNIFSHAFYPLTLPLTVGPGSISVAITLGANATRHLGPNFRSMIAALIGSAFIAITIFFCYGFSDRLERLIGATGMSVVMRLSSFLLVCIGVQVFWNGLRALLLSIPALAH